MDPFLDLAAANESRVGEALRPPCERCDREVPLDRLTALVAVEVVVGNRAFVVGTE